MDAGPASTLFRRLNIAYAGRRRDVAIAAIILALGTWLPLVGFSLNDGLLLNGTKLPLLYDIGTYVRFLFALPLLVLAEIIIGGATRRIMHHLVSAGLVPTGSEAQFAGLIERTNHLYASRAATALLVFIIAAFEWFTLSTQARLRG